MHFSATFVDFLADYGSHGELRGIRLHTNHVGAFISSPPVEMSKNWGLSHGQFQVYKGHYLLVSEGTISWERDILFGESGQRKGPLGEIVYELAVEGHQADEGAKLR